MYEEAIRAGKEALEALEDAADSLDSAKHGASWTSSAAAS